jgi:hypothetical protein
VFNERVSERERDRERKREKEREREREREREHANTHTYGIDAIHPLLLPEARCAPLYKWDRERVLYWCSIW